MFSKNHQLLKTHKVCLFDNHVCDNRASCRGVLYPTITYEKSDTFWLGSLEGSASFHGLNGLLPTGEFIDIPYSALIPDFSKDKELLNIYHDAENNHFWLTDASSKNVHRSSSKEITLYLRFSVKICLFER